MGLRGPQKGFKAARQAGAPALLDEPEKLSASDRENPDKLSGAALRELAYRRGMARSALTDMPDEMVRLQLRYITNRQYTEGIA